MSLSFLLCLAVGPSFAERVLNRRCCCCCFYFTAFVERCAFVSIIVNQDVAVVIVCWEGLRVKKILKYIFCAVFHLMERIKCNHLTDRWQQFKSISTLSEYELGNLLFCYSFWGVCVCCFIITSETALIHTHRETFSLSKFPFLVAFSTRPSSFAYWKFPSIVLHATQAGFTGFRSRNDYNDIAHRFCDM